MGKVRFRYTAPSLDFSTGIHKPNFPNRTGLSLHSYVSNKPTLTTTSRLFGTTEINWQSTGIKKANRDTIYEFWNTYLLDGFNQFTVIDNKSRLLFQTAWTDWDETYRSTRGGTYDINYHLRSPVPWTPALFAYYSMPVNSNPLTPIYNHALQDNTNVTLQSAGSTVNKAGDSNVLSNAGYALKCTQTAGTDVAAVGTGLTLNRHKNNNSMSIFCQVRCPTVSTDQVILCRIADTAISNGFELSVSSTSNDLVGTYFLGANYESIDNTGVTTVPANTWYDVCFTFDAVNQNLYLYTWPCDTTTFTNFLNGETTITDHLVSYTSPTYVLDTESFSRIDLLLEGAAGSLSDNAYLQHIFLIDDYITPMEFNFFRRLCFFWNSKTSGSWPR